MSKRVELVLVSWLSQRQVFCFRLDFRSVDRKGRLFCQSEVLRFSTLAANHFVTTNLTNPEVHWCHVSMSLLCSAMVSTISILLQCYSFAFGSFEITSSFGIR